MGNNLNQPNCKIYLTTQDGSKFYFAQANNDGTFTIPAPSATVRSIATLPIDWDKAAITWNRHPDFLGVFRSQSESFKFIKDARAILLSLYYASGGGIQGECVMRIDLFIDVNVGYQTAYESEIDFSTIEDIKYQNNVSGLGGNPVKEGELMCNTLDSLLYSYLQSNGDTQFNLPIWKNTGTSSAPNWIPNDNVIFILHNGISLLYQASYSSAAQPTQGSALYYCSMAGSGIQLLFPATPTPNPNPQQDNHLGGWQGGNRNGFHTIPSLAKYDIVQANGTTTFIGNDILEPFLIQGSQNSGASAFVNEQSFAGINNSQPYTRNNFSLKNFLQNITGTADVWLSMTVTFVNNINSDNSLVLDDSDSPNVYISLDRSGGTIPSLSFVLFEVDDTDNPLLVGGAGSNFANPIEILKISLTDISHSGYHGFDFFSLNNDVTLSVGAVGVAGIGATFGSYTITVPSGIIQTTLDVNKVYVFGVISDNVGGTNPCESECIMTNLEFTIASYYIKPSGTNHGIHVNAPALNPSVFAAMRLKDVLATIVPDLNTSNTDGYGFPIPIADNPFKGVSEFLSDETLTIGDCCAYQVALTSQYCIHNLQGQSYLTISLNQLHNFCKKILGTGLAIQPNGTTIEIERLSKYFDKSTMILNLGTNVSQLHIKPFNDLAGSNLQLGYAKADTNSDFGVDPFNTELYFNTPLFKKSGAIDWQETDILTEQYAIEKIRAQQVNQPVGAGYNPANPSTQNQTVAFYCFNEPVQPIINGIILPIYDPNNNNYAPTGVFPLTQRYGSTLGVNGGNGLPCAQDFDPAATGAPYIYGMYYPDTALNLELSPCRAITRDGGGLLHSVLDLFDEQDLVFRNTIVIQYNNSVSNLSGIQSNISASTGLITEFADINISSLPTRLFRPFLFEIETVVPVNMYTIMNSNPNGYVQFTWKGVVFQGFIWETSQKLAASQPTKLTLIAHPNTTNAQMINS